MQILPAIDLKQGRCVRLRQGLMEQETRYSDDPVAVAQHWQSLGAPALHLVDLDGAIEGAPRNLPHVEAIVKSLTIPVQVGGGIRSLGTIHRYLSLGVFRVVLGTAAVEDPTMLGEACRRFPGRIVVGLDVRDGQVALKGWTHLTAMTVEDCLARLSRYDLGGIVFTDISKDGMLAGPNVEALKAIAQRSPFPVVASGGITTIDDIYAVKQLGAKISGVIIGKALYEGTLTLPAALAAASEDARC
ncbi:MAG: 1-(5-phosphoribosyl)-5-[(5-phosphoribosylamino)methylideneamino]imidazole-4-carboxamide isomerase [Nitrospirae bacterium]|nr:MAG: 1-(5-phosphoribosyl)-5-[(5-phosphoribosylamino)methylideneamino]imidazole-4-carboxamide isomerase [Nitrospirota bacterium]